MSRLALAFKVVSAATTLALAHAALADPVLNNNTAHMTVTSLSRTAKQDALPLWWNRGADLEGGIRFGGDVPASPGFNSGMGAATMGGIELASLGFAMSEVDMALPTNGPSVVIGRSFNHRHEDDAKVSWSNGLQGYNWFQSAMPEIVVYAGGGANDDIVYLVYGANRFMEFKETSTTGKFKGMNGTTGVVIFTAGNGSTTYDTYTITDQNGWSWVFWGDVTGTKADYQLWKKTDPQGLTVYAGDKTAHGTAISSGYATNGGFSTVYQEFGDPGSPSERRYLFTYSTVASVDRLTQVSAQIKSSGTWASPSGLTEIGRVSYDYYTTSTSGSGGAADFYGNGGDLKTVKVRTPLTDSGTGSGTDLGSGIYDERTKYYRYYDTYNASSGRLGHPHTLKLVLGFEGCRRFDWDDNATLDDSFTGTTSNQETGDLKPYADAYYEYESSSSTQRVSSAFFNGECGCGGGSTNGTYTFTYEEHGSASTYRGNGSYDTGWATRTIIDQPDALYQVRYFDELGQPLSTVLTTNTGGSTHWVTGVDRDSSGRVTTVHSPANLNTYTHSTGAITYLSSSSTGGLITNIGRVASGDRAGLVESTGYQTGTGGSNQLLSETTLSQRDASISSITLSKPIIASSRQCWGTGGSDYDTTTYTFAWWSGTNTSPLYVTPKSVTTTLPAVATGHNGANSTHDSVSYLRKDGRTAFSVATDGIWTAMRYNEMGLPIRTVRDADPSVSGDFDSNYGPGDYSLSTSSNSGLTYASEAGYDSIGRSVTSTARPGGSAERVSVTYYSRLSDGRLAVISSPRYVASGTPTWYGPMSIGISNHAGKGEFSATLGVASTTTAKTGWLDETYSDPIYALENASANLAGSGRANVFGVKTMIYSTSGSKLSESRSYVALAASSSWTGAAGTDYDATEYSYDNMGRGDRVKDPTGTITRTVFDNLGRTVSTWVGTVDTNGWTGSSGNVGADDLTQLSLTEFDSGGVGNSHVTKRTQYVSGDSSTGIGSSTGKRETTYQYDVRGRAVVTIPPQMPCSVTAYDVRSRPTATALYTSSSGLSASTDPAVTGTQSNRTALSKTFYDSRGQVYKAQRFKVDQSDGSDDDSLESLTWRDAAGRVIKQGGTANSKTAYDRLGRVTHQYTLARNNDSGYGDADDVTGDIVLEQSDTLYDDVDKTGLVFMTATIMRNYDDASTTGALDTNADNDAKAYDQTGTPDVKGRIQITAYWYDELDRQQDVVQYGTYNYADFDRQPSSSWLSVPSRSSTALRTTTVYNDNGTVQKVQAPKVSGGNPLETYWVYDQAMRKIAEIRNHTGAGAANNYTDTVTPAVRDTDVYTRYTFEDGLMKTVWVDIDGDNTLDAGDQVTTYAYGPTKGTGSSDSFVKDNRLLANVLYPAQGFVGETTAKRTVAFAYNAQGEKKYQLDNNGVVLAYTFDTGGRKVKEVATPTGSVDTYVQCIEWSYLSRGLIEKVTQSASSGGTVRDEVLYLYDDWGNLTDFRQDNNGVVTNSSPDDYDMVYTYSKVDTTSPTSGTRRSGIRRTVAGVYRGLGLSAVGSKKYEVTNTFANSENGDTLFDADCGRVTYTQRTYPSSTVDLEVYRYGGAGTQLVGYLPESAVQSRTAWPGTSGWDLGYDRFGRPIRTYIYKNGAGTYVDLRVSHDDNSNITAVENAWVTPASATYESDGLNRLKGLEFGIMTTGAISTVVQKEDWQTSGTLKLDQTGNWIDYKRTRETATQDEWTANTFNDVNVYTKVNRVGAADWDPEYDAKGLPKWDDKTSMTNKGYQYIFDAWDRLVKVRGTNGNDVTTYRYNGLGHRIRWSYDSDTDGDVDGSDDAYDLQYNEKWQQVAMYLVGNTNPQEVFTYGQAGADGYGGSSYIDKVICRERDANLNGAFDDRYYYLQNWRHDVVAIMDSDGKLLERVAYDAYGRPHGFSPGDIKTAGAADRPDGVLDANDTWSTGSVVWNKDLGNSSNQPIPDGAVTSADGVTLTNIKATSYSAGYGILSDSTLVGNRKGLAGYEFDVILNGAATADEKPIYHVRHRVLAADTGKWFQKDPLGYHDGMDLYEYCKTDPLAGLDPTGMAVQARKCIAAEEVLVEGPTRRVRRFGTVNRVNFTAIADETSLSIQANAYSVLWLSGVYQMFVESDSRGAVVKWGCGISCSRVAVGDEWQGDWRISTALNPDNTSLRDSSFRYASSIRLQIAQTASPATGFPLTAPPRIEIEADLFATFFGSLSFGVGGKVGGGEVGGEVGADSDEQYQIGAWAWECCCRRSALLSGLDERLESHCEQKRIARFLEQQRLAERRDVRNRKP